MQKLSPPDDEQSDADTMTPTKTTVEFASSAKLLAHPAAGAMALSAISLGWASQAVGAWFSAMNAAAEASLQMWRPLDTVDGERDGPVTASDDPAVTILPKAVDAVDAQVLEAPVLDAPVVEAPVLEANASVETAPSEPVVAAAVPDLVKPMMIDRPDSVDDLKRIGGIGPKLERVLNDLGIWTYAQIAGWSEAEIAWVEDFTGFKGRISRDGWIAQAAQLGKSGIEQG